MANDASAQRGPNALDDEGGWESDPLSGTRIGPYEVLGALIRGEPQTLLAFRTQEPEVGQLVLLRRQDAHPGALPALRTDAARAAAVVSPALERVVGLETSEGGTFWVSEYVPGATLTEIRTACERAGRPVPMGLALAALGDAATGVQAIHASASQGPLTKPFHGLLRPNNIVVMVTGAAKVLHPKYLRLPPGASLDQQPLLGNAGYLSPEAIQGQPQDARSDVFSLAVLAHEFITGQLPFRGRTPRERADAALRGEPPPASRLNLSMDQKVDQVLAKAMSLNPSARYANAAEFLRALKPAASGFMWRESQRADFLGSVFPGRVRRLHALAGDIRQRLDAAAARAAAEERARAEAAAAEAQAKAAAQKAAEEAAAAARAAVVPTTASGVLNAQRPSTRPGWFPFAVGGGALALVLGVTGIVHALRKEPPPPPPVVPPPPPVLILPDASAAEDAGLDGGWDGGEAGDGGEGEHHAPKRRHRSNEPSVPAWLR